MENKTQTEGKTSTESIGVSEMQKKITQEIWDAIQGGYTCDVFPEGKVYPYVGKNYNDRAIATFSDKERMSKQGGFFEEKKEEDWDEEGRQNYEWRMPKKKEILEWVKKQEWDEELKGAKN